MSNKIENSSGADDPDSAAFWNAAAEGRLIFSQCTQCNSIGFPPRGLCSRCGGECMEKNSAGKGEIFTWSRVHRSGETGFGDRVPYVVAMIALDEGFRTMANVEPVDAVEIGKRCTVTFRPSPSTGHIAPWFILD